jgi:hypothetical protein
MTALHGTMIASQFTFFSGTTGSYERSVATACWTLRTPLSVCLPTCLSAYLSVCLHVCLSAYLSVRLSVCLPTYLSFCLPTFLFGWLPLLSFWPLSQHNMAKWQFHAVLLWHHAVPYSICCTLIAQHNTLTAVHSMVAASRSFLIISHRSMRPSHRLSPHNSPTHRYLEDGSENKWWMQFSKRNFMNIKGTA